MKILENVFSRGQSSTREVHRLICNATLVHDCSVQANYLGLSFVMTGLRVLCHLCLLFLDLSVS